LQHRAVIDNRTTHYDPLHLALLKGMTGVAIALTKAGANPDTMSRRGDAVDVAQLMLDVDYLEFLTAVPPRPDAATTRAVRAGLVLIDHRKASRIKGPWNQALTRDTEVLQRRLGLPPDGHPSLALVAAIMHGLQRVYARVGQRDELAELQRLQGAFPGLTATQTQRTATP
jgi:hypothetical protein